MGGLRRPFSELPKICIRSSKHLDAVDVNGISSHLPSHGDVMSDMFGDCIRIIDGKDLVIAIGDHDDFSAFLDTFLAHSALGLSPWRRTLNR